MKKHTTLKSKFNSAFSLVELLVVIAVIAVIAAIAIPNIAGTRDAAIAAQESYDTAQIDQMRNQLQALGYNGTVDATTLAGTGIEHDILNPDGSVLKTVTFKLE
jgi:prepilin-type N-terminal cleavage/methylation domain-containing protein